MLSLSLMSVAVASHLVLSCSQNTRKIVGAILQRVSYREWIPEVLGPEVVRQQKIGLRDSGRTNGYKANIDASIM